MSEVVRLMQQITQEYEAAQQALLGLSSGTAKHNFITQRMENMGNYQEALQKIVGVEEGARLTLQALEQANN
jgi:hypothetical protein